VEALQDVSEDVSIIEILEEQNIKNQNLIEQIEIEGDTQATYLNFNDG
jgi:hypothetical protein